MDYLRSRIIDHFTTTSMGVSKCLRSCPSSPCQLRKSEHIAVSVTPQPFMTQQEIWAYPNASDLAPRRLVNCANLITSLGANADELRRYICALNLREKETSQDLFTDLSKHPVISEILAKLSPSQLGAFHHIKDSKHNIVLIQGPSGTGKTTRFRSLERWSQWKV